MNQPDTNEPDTNEPEPDEPATDAAPRRRGHDAGEGVISAAIAVLIIATIGALMWFGFQQLWETTESRTNDQVEQIGS